MRDRSARGAAREKAPLQKDRLLRELLFLAFSAWRRNDDWIADRLWRSLGERKVVAGEALYTIGELPDRVYFMNEGSLRFSRSGAASFTREGRWVLGIQEAVSGTPRYRTAVALTDIRFLTVPTEAWLSILEDNSDMARGMTQGSAGATVALHEQLAPDGGFKPPRAARWTPGRPANQVERLLLLRDVSLLGGAGVQALTDLARSAEEVRFDEGQTVFRRDEPRTHLFVVIDGLVVAGRADLGLSAKFGPGDVVGGAAAFGEGSRPWEARALQRTRVLAVPVEIWEDEMDDHFDLFRSAMAALLEQREELTDELAARAGDLVLR